MTCFPIRTGMAGALDRVRGRRRDLGLGLVPASTLTRAPQTCTAGFTRARECTDQYIPALVALRVRLDVPAGIAEQDRKLGRPGLVQEAMGEWSSDSTDEAIATSCQKMAAAPRERVGAYLDGAERCLTMSGCQAYVDCVMPLHEATFSASR